MKSWMKWVGVAGLIFAMLAVSACGGGGASNNSAGGGSNGTSNGSVNGTANGAAGSTAGEDSQITQKSYIKQNFKFSSGQPDGIMYPTAVSILTLMQNHLGYEGDMNLFPGGAISNVINVQTGQGDFGLTYSSATYSALKGDEPFGEPAENIRAVATLFPFYAQWVTLPDSGINSIADLKGKKVNLGTKGQASQLVAIDILEAYGMSEADLAKVEYLSFNDGLQQLKDGHLDAVFWQQNAPYSGFSDLAQTRGMKLLPIDPEKIKTMQQKNPGLLDGVIKAGTYTGVDEDIRTVRTPLTVVTSKNHAEDLIYDMVKAMAEHFGEFQELLPPMKEVESAEGLAENIGVEMHPGAKKFYEEQGWLK